MLSIVRDDLSDTNEAMITLYIANEGITASELGPRERSQISSYILRNYPNQRFSKVRLEYCQERLTTILAIHTTAAKCLQVPAVSTDIVEEWLGARLGWDTSSQTLTVFKQGRIVQAVIDQAYLRAEGVRVSLERPVRLLNGAVRFPLKIAAEALGITVEAVLPESVWIQLDGNK